MIYWSLCHDEGAMYDVTNTNINAVFNYVMSVYFFSIEMIILLEGVKVQVKGK